MCLEWLASARLAAGTVALICAVNSQASLLDCAKTPATHTPLNSNCIVAEPEQLPLHIPHHSISHSVTAGAVTHSGFQINQPQRAGALSNSVPLIVFSIFLIVVLLIRAKSINSK